MKQLPHTFFDSPAATVARDLIGCFLVRKRGKVVTRYMITETEAYDGPMDKASHASRGKTARNEIMFRSAGHIYVYFTYGMHWMLNIVTGPLGHPAAVFIRGLRSEKTEQPSKNKVLLNGPAKLAKRLGITGTLNGKKLGSANGLWVETGPTKVKAKDIRRSSRVGVEYAGPFWSKRKWRFTIKV